MDDSLEFSSQIVEEEDFFFDDEDEYFEQEGLDQQEESIPVALDIKRPESEDEHKSFKSLLAGPSTNKVGSMDFFAVCVYRSNQNLGWLG